MVRAGATAHNVEMRELAVTPKNFSLAFRAGYARSPTRDAIPVPQRCS